MTERDQNEIGREETESAAAPRRRGRARRLLTALLVLVLVLGAVAFAAYSDLNNVDSLKRLLNYNKTTAEGGARTEQYAFDSDRTNQFALLEDKLLVVSSTRMTLVERDGTAVFTQNVKLDAPAIATGSKLAAVYDVGGTALYLVNEKGAVRDASELSESGIISAALSAENDLTLTVRKSGYKSAVCVYDASLNPRFAFNSSDHYVMDARMLPDGKHMAAVTLGESDGAFASKLSLFALDSEKAVSENRLSGSLVLSLRDLGETLCAIEDDRITFFRADGSLAGSWRYEYPYLRACSVGGGHAAVLLSRYRSGSALRLVSVDGEGNVLGVSDVRREVLDVSAAGKYTAVLYGDSLTIFLSDLTEYAALEDTGYAKRVLMRDDGTAVLVGTSGAWLFVP